MFTDTIHPLGWVYLFRALNRPCECEAPNRRKNWNRGRHFRTCKRDPFPYPGFRWYQEDVRERAA